MDIDKEETENMEKNNWTGGQMESKKKKEDINRQGKKEKQRQIDEYIDRWR